MINCKNNVFLPEKKSHFALILSERTPPKNLLIAYAVFWLLEIVPENRKTKNFVIIKVFKGI